MFLVRFSSVSFNRKKTSLFSCNDTTDVFGFLSLFFTCGFTLNKRCCPEYQMSCRCRSTFVFLLFPNDSNDSLLSSPPGHVWITDFKIVADEFPVSQVSVSAQPWCMWGPKLMPWMTFFVEEGVFVFENFLVRISSSTCNNTPTAEQPLVVLVLSIRHTSSSIIAAFNIFSVGLISQWKPSAWPFPTSRSLCRPAGQAEAELKEFGPYYRKQFSVARLAQVEDDLEQHKEKITQLLKQRVRVWAFKLLPDPWLSSRTFTR